MVVDQSVKTLRWVVQQYITNFVCGNAHCAGWAEHEGYDARPCWLRLSGLAGLAGWLNMLVGLVGWLAWPALALFLCWRVFHWELSKKLCRIRATGQKHVVVFFARVHRLTKFCL